MSGRPTESSEKSHKNLICIKKNIEKCPVCAIVYVELTLKFDSLIRHLVICLFSNIKIALSNSSVQKEEDSIRGGGASNQ